MGIFDRRRKGLKKDDVSSGASSSSSHPKVEISKGSEILTGWRMEEISKFEPSSLPEPSKAFLPSESSESFASSHWPDEASRIAEARLEGKGIQIPWHYGDQFGDDFRVMGLRAGGVGAVLFVESERFGEKRLYAAKTLQRFLHEEYLSKPSWWQKKVADDFLEEALPWLEMGQHAYIVPIHLLENIIHPKTGRNIPFVFSGFMEKGDLRQFVIEKGRFSLEETLILGIQICEALIHAYQYRLSAHKDLKPDNIMVYGDGIYKVTDFSAGIIGTPGYMAPEQVAVSLKMREQVIDHRADQFAIGLIMHDVFKGNPQLEQKKRKDYIRFDPRRVIKEGIGEVLSDELPPSLKGITVLCLQPESKDRFPDISELKKELLKAYRDEFKKEYQFPEAKTDNSPHWWFNRGLAFHTIGRAASAVIPFKEALKRYKAIPGTEIDQANCFYDLGNAHWTTGQFSKAETHYRDALKEYEAIPGTEIERAYCLWGLGVVYFHTGQFSKADTHYRDALKRLEAITGTEIDQANCFKDLGNVYWTTGQFSKAETHYRDALKKLEAIPGTEDYRAKCLLNLGFVYAGTGQFERAETHYRDALKKFETIPGTEIDQARCLTNLGIVYSDTGQFEKAESHHQEALKRFSAIPGTEIDQAKCLVNLGILYSRIQKFEMSKEVVQRSLNICDQYPLGTEQIRKVCLGMLKQLK
jgi:tetratricopeptide (TPR) repeat protein